MFQVHSLYCLFYRHFRKSLTHPRRHTKVAVAAFTGSRSRTLPKCQKSNAFVLNLRNTFDREEGNGRKLVPEIDATINAIIYRITC